MPARIPARPAPLRHILPLSCLFAAALLLAACAPRIADDDPGYAYANPQPQRVYPGSVPVQVFDRFTLFTFAQRHAEGAHKAGLSVQPDGRAEPSGPLVPQDYQPESWGLELALRLNLRSFPSLFLGFTDDSRRTLASPQWTVTSLDKGSLTVTSPDLISSLVIFATLDWNGNGVRDWLVLLSQKTPHDESYTLGYWIMVEDPAPKGLLQARLLSLDEYRGIGQPVPRAGEDARTFLDTLLREKIQPASQEAARKADEEAKIKALLKK